MSTTKKRIRIEDISKPSERLSELHKEDFKPLEELAQLLGGQVGNTRPLAEDRKWFTNWVGLSGKKTKPTLYIGCGISGMIQHVAGMRDSNVVVTVNKDPEAPIFEVADYIVVGDLYEIVPALVEALKKELKKLKKELKELKEG